MSQSWRTKHRVLRPPGHPATPTSFAICPIQARQASAASSDTAIAWRPAPPPPSSIAGLDRQFRSRSTVSKVRPFSLRFFLFCLFSIADRRLSPATLAHASLSLDRSPLPSLATSHTLHSTLLARSLLPRSAPLALLRFACSTASLVAASLSQTVDLTVTKTWENKTETWDLTKCC